MVVANLVSVSKVSEELNSVETSIKLVRITEGHTVSEELNSVETIDGIKKVNETELEFQKNLIVWKL